MWVDPADSFIIYNQAVETFGCKSIFFTSTQSTERTGIKHLIRDDGCCQVTSQQLILSPWKPSVTKRKQTEQRKNTTFICLNGKKTNIKLNSFP